MYDWNGQFKILLKANENLEGIELMRNISVHANRLIDSLNRCNI